MERSLIFQALDAAPPASHSRQITLPLTSLRTWERSEGHTLVFSNKPTHGSQLRASLHPVPLQEDSPPCPLGCSVLSASSPPSLRWSRPRLALVYISRSWHSPLPPTGRFKTTEICSLPDLEASSTESMCWQGWFLPEAPRENLFQASLLISGGARQSLAFLALKTRHSVSASVFPWPSPCLSLSRML